MKTLFLAWLFSEILDEAYYKYKGLMCWNEKLENLIETSFLWKI